MIALTPNKYYFITDGCDELGDGRYCFRVLGTELEILLDGSLVYEDTESDYVDPSGRRHFHPNHEIKNIHEVLIRTLLNMEKSHGS